MPLQIYEKKKNMKSVIENKINDAVMKLDLEQVLRDKLPNKKLPGFIVRYLKRIVHQDNINALFVQARGKRNLDFIRESIQNHLNSGAEIEGVENLPPVGGRYIFVSNHPLGGLDSLIIGDMLGEKYGDKLKYFANDVLMYLEPLKEMFLPVNKGGKGGDLRENAKAVEAFFKSDAHLITFPSGAGSRKINGKVQDLPWIKTFVTKAVQYERDVVPIYFEGRNSNFFYNLSLIRTKLGLPNIEMLYLVNEMYKQRGKEFKLRVGEMIPYSTFDKSKTPKEWAAWVRAKVYEMETPKP